jgi:hypothetical protein
MTDALMGEVLEAPRRLSLHVPDATWYGFGSYFRHERPFGDVDVLLVCPTSEDVVLARGVTENVCSRWPLHLVIMTTDEQVETQFVEITRSVAIYPA